MRDELTDEKDIREAGDDHPYGAWGGGSKAGGGRMGGGGGAAERETQDGFLSDKAPAGKFEALQGGGQDHEFVSPEGIVIKGKVVGFQGDRAVIEQNDKRYYVNHKAQGKKNPLAMKQDRDLTSPDPMVRQKAEYKQAVAGKKDTWVAGGGGSEEVFTRQGSRYQRVYNPKRQEHGYLDLGQDTVFTDNALKAAGKTYPNDRSRSVQRTISKQVKDDRFKFNRAKG